MEIIIEMKLDIIFGISGYGWIFLLA